jgi:peptide/nickel transport system permease protein
MSAPLAVQAAPAAAASRVGKAGFVIGIAIVALIAAAAIRRQCTGAADPFVQDLGNRLKPPFWMEGNDPTHISAPINSGAITSRGWSTARASRC